MQSLADRVLSRPIAVGQGLVDNRDRPRAVIVTVGKVPSLEQRCTYRLQVLRPHLTPVDLHGLVLPGHIAFRLENIRMDGETQRREVSQSDRLYARQRFHTREHLSVKRNALGPRIARGPQIKVRQKHMVGIEPRIGVQFALEAADEQSGTD